MTQREAPRAAPGIGAPGEEERTWGMLVHLAAFAGVVLPLGGNLLGPWLVWRSRRDRSAFVQEQGREALNFNLTVCLAALVCVALVYVFIGVLLGLALLVYWVAMTLLAGIRAGEGVHYRYPLALRWLR
jgi:uncharacterized protein